MIRDFSQSKIDDQKSAIEFAQRALKLDEWAKTQYPVERDFVQAHWLLGTIDLKINTWNLNGLKSPVLRLFFVKNIPNHYLNHYSYRIDGQPNLAEYHLSEALTGDRAINLVEMEANILLDLARLRYEQKNYEETKFLAKEALSIIERCGYVLQGADVNLFLAQYALEQGQNKAKAKEYAETALKLATCEGPPYYYKVAYEEAERMLESLK